MCTSGRAPVAPGGGRASLAMGPKAGVCVLDHGADEGAVGAPGGRPAPLLVAAPASADSSFGVGEADVLLDALPPEPDAAAQAALAAGLRAGDRPLLLDVVDPQTEPDAVIAGFDVGAAGALFHGGDLVE